MTDSGYAGILADAAVRWPDRSTLHFEGATWTYGDLHAAVLRASGHLAAAGVGVGTRVALLIENSPLYLIAQFALARLGAVFVTPNPYWTTRETSHALQAARVDWVLHSDGMEPPPDSADAALPAESLLLASSSPDAPALRPDPLSHRYIPFSSGTTGMPKGAVHTDGSLCGAVRQLRHHLALSESDRIQIALPLCHIFGTTMSAAAISVGAPITVFRRFDLEESLRHIVDAGVTVWPIAGAMAQRLVERPDLPDLDLSALRFFMWGGSAVPPGLARRITAATGVRFLCSYGMTEAMMVAFNPVAQPDLWRLDSPGFPTEGTALRLTDAGELEVRGPSVAAGYAGVRSEAFTPDGWFRTGDLAHIDDDGRVTIVDRIKDMIKVSGFQVSPVEVESALSEHPDVAEAGVVGRPDARDGEAPVAFVVSRAVVTEQALTQHLSTRLATYKRPREYRFVDALPRTVGGKLRRRALAEWANDVS
ncbi:class I adenylate-forming enzyme family protein [Mycobacterium sp. pW049]|uniref:class I adenylate-forming enzyme family protein n=1 Tax=[Mycobacterium] bulgaricum TaxID=3238985 RepID=UPI00351B7C58